MSDTRVTAAHTEALYQIRMSTRLTAQNIDAPRSTLRPPTRGSAMAMAALSLYAPLSRLTTLAVEVLHAQAAVVGRRTMTMG